MAVKKPKKCFVIGGTLLPDNYGKSGRKHRIASGQELTFDCVFDLDKDRTVRVLRHLHIEVYNPMTREQLSKKLDWLKKRALKTFDKMVKIDERCERLNEKARKRNAAEARRTRAS